MSNRLCFLLDYHQKNGSDSYHTYALAWEIAKYRNSADAGNYRMFCVLISSTPDAGEEGSLNAAELLKNYKGLYGIVNNLSFLKDDLIVNELFFKTPSRIEVQGMILIIALII